MEIARHRARPPTRARDWTISNIPTREPPPPRLTGRPAHATLGWVEGTPRASAGRGSRRPVRGAGGVTPPRAYQLSVVSPSIWWK